MAKKSSTSVKKEASSAAPKAATKKAAPKKKAAAQTAAKTATPKKKAAAPKAAAPKKAATAAPKKKAAPLKLTDKQTELLKKVKDSGATGYTTSAKMEERSLEALKDKKLLKRGAKNKETKQHPYTLTKTGEKHTSTPATSA